MRPTVANPHLPDAAWDCRGCGGEWPCGAARESLNVAYADDPGGLAMFMCGRLEEAAPDLAGRHHPDRLFERFIAWTKPEPLDANSYT